MRVQGHCEGPVQVCGAEPYRFEPVVPLFVFSFSYVVFLKELVIPLGMENGEILDSDIVASWKVLQKRVSKIVNSRFTQETKKRFSCSLSHGT